MGGIFAQSSVDVYALNMHNRAPKDLENVHDIPYDTLVQTGELGHTHTQTNTLTLPNALSPLLRGR